LQSKRFFGLGFQAALPKYYREYFKNRFALCIREFKCYCIRETPGVWKTGREVREGAVCWQFYSTYTASNSLRKFLKDLATSSYEDE